MLYDFSSHIQELQDDPNKKENTLDKYTRYFGSLDGMDLHGTLFFKKYLDKFEFPFLLSTPEDIEEDFDWDLLVKLIAGSFSSNYDLALDEEWKKNPNEMPKAHIYITVTHGKETVTKDIEELWCFQVLRLFEIYVEEQMNLFSFMAEEKAKAGEDLSLPDFQDDEEAPKEFVIEQRKRMEIFKQKVELLKNEVLSTRKLFNAF